MEFECSQRGKMGRHCDDFSEIAVGDLETLKRERVRKLTALCYSSYRNSVALSLSSLPIYLCRLSISISIHSPVSVPPTVSQPCSLSRLCQFDLLFLSLSSSSLSV